MDDTERRIDEFLSEVISFEKRNRGRMTAELQEQRATFGNRWDFLCLDRMRLLAPGSDRNEVESRLVATGKIVTDWWDLGWSATSEQFAQFVDGLNSAQDSLRRIWADMPYRTAVIQQDDFPIPCDAEDALVKAGVQPLPLRLIRLMWHKASTEIADLTPYVWGDHPTPGQLKAACHKANESFDESKIRRSLHAAGDRITQEIFPVSTEVSKRNQ